MDIQKILVIYDGCFDIIIYCYWLGNKISKTNCIKYISISYKSGNIATPYPSTYVLIEFDESFEIDDENYFNYRQIYPKMVIIESSDDFNRRKRYVNATDDYSKLFNKDIIFNDFRVFLGKYLYHLLELYALREAFRDKINSNQKFISEWSIYCKVKIQCCKKNSQHLICENTRHPWVSSILCVSAKIKY